MRADEDERDATIDAVVFEDAFRQQRTIARAAADHAVQADIDVARP